METDIDVVVQAIENVLNGAALPALNSPEHRQLMDSIKCIVGDGALEHAEYRQLGVRTIKLVLQHFKASMCAERELALLRGKGKPLC